MNKMKITGDLIKSLCPSIGVSNKYSATIPEFIVEYRDKHQSKKDIIQVLLSPKFMTDKELRLFQVRHMKQVMRLMTEDGVLRALKVSDRYAEGLSSEEEFNTAWGDALPETCKGKGFKPKTHFAGWLLAARTIWELATDDDIDYLLELFIKKELATASFPLISS